MMRNSISRSDIIKQVGLVGKREAAKFFGVSTKTVARRLFDFGLTEFSCKIALLPDFTQRQYDFITGWMLGDGCIPATSKPNNMFRFGQSVFTRSITASQFYTMFALQTCKSKTSLV